MTKPKIFERIAVVGAGQMGAGIAQVAAQSGSQVILVDASEKALSKAEAGISKSLEKLASKEKISESPAAIVDRIQFETGLSSVAGFAPEMVIEAVSENEALKKSIFTELDSQLSEETVYCSNTSSISITRLAATVRRPENFMGMHFMNPVPLMKLVELIEGLGTSPEVSASVRATAEKMSKVCVVSKDRAGFIINRVLMPMINEAFWALGEELGTAEDIDTGMKLGTNQPMGPLTLADFIGLDTTLSILEVLQESYGDKFRPAPLLRQYVEAGWVGRKAGRGVYKYES